jgi:hypothetical protein
MRNMLSGKIFTLVFLSLCLINVHGLKIQTQTQTTNPMGLKGAPLIGFVENLHAGLTFFQRAGAAEWVFYKVADVDGKMMSRKGMKNFLSKCAEMMGGGGPIPEAIIDRFYGEATKNMKGEISFAGFKAEMIFAISRDITDFTKDILKEQPNWKFIQMRN